MCGDPVAGRGMAVLNARFWRSIMRPCLRLLFPLYLMLFLVPAMAETDRPGGLSEGIEPGELKVLKIGNKPPERELYLPLKQSEVQIKVSGFVARATVIQHYTNPFQAPIEAVYTFPLPNDAAVDGMSMRVGDKLIRGLIKKRDEARKIYEKARSEGKRSSLLEQERANIFTQSVANIMPGDSIRVEITYVDILKFQDEGAFELVFPMVVGPRYIAGQVVGKQGTGWAADTDQVGDASRITPPVLKPGERSGHNISLEVELDAAVPVQGVHSVSHAVDIDAPSDMRRKIRLHPSDTLPNKDFVLRYKVAGKAPEVALISHYDAKKGGYFTFVALPQQQVGDAATVARDLIFILDTSGSMRGFPLNKSKEAMYRLINGMRPTDRFNVIRFAGDTGALWPAPRPKTPENEEQAVAFIEKLKGAGGTEMRKGIGEALTQASDPDRLRIAFLLTDGYVGNELDILKNIEQERRGARVFTLGVGSSPNRFLLDRAATVGMGEAFYLRQDQSADETIERFFKRVDRPNLAHVSIDWDGLDVYDITPARIPDLWQGQPVLVHGRYRRPGSARINVSGLLGGRQYDWPIPVSLVDGGTENAVMASVWARAKVKEHLLEMSRGEEIERLTEAVTELGLDYSIMTRWTSFVAVEEKTVNENGRMKTVVQPVELPEGVDYGGVFGDSSEQQPMRFAARSMKFKSGSLANMKMHGIALPAPSPSAPLSLVQPAPVAPPAERVAKAPVPQPAAPAPAHPGCSRSALSVSGGLHYAEVDQALRQAWPELCRSLQGLYRSRIYFNVSLTVKPDGSVTRVHLRTPGSVSRELADRIRTWFKQRRFGTVRGGGQARVTLDLNLKP